MEKRLSSETNNLDKRLPSAFPLIHFRMGSISCL